ncbi:hypothetical protein GCM10009577_01580 [Streptomyces javensis]
MRRQRLGQQPLPVLEGLGGGDQGRRDLVGRWLLHGDGQAGAAGPEVAVDDWSLSWRLVAPHLTLEPVRHGFDIAVEATGRVAQLALAVKSLASEGICESAGNHFRPGELPLLDMYLTGVTLRVGARQRPGPHPRRPSSPFSSAPTTARRAAVARSVPRASYARCPPWGDDPGPPET